MIRRRAETRTQKCRATRKKPAKKEKEKGEKGTHNISNLRSCTHLVRRSSETMRSLTKKLAVL